MDDASKNPVILQNAPFTVEGLHLQVEFYKMPCLFRASSIFIKLAMHPNILRYLRETPFLAALPVQLRRCPLKCLIDASSIII